MSTDHTLPRYRCHKEVHALKIQSLRRPAVFRDDGRLVVIPVESGYVPFEVSAEYVEKHNPQVGGYWVLYEDGYQSFSQARAFEDGYTRIVD